jgi:hypothetical protein
MVLGILYFDDLSLVAISASLKSFVNWRNTRFATEKPRKLECSWSRSGGCHVYNYVWFKFTGDHTAQSRQCCGR